MSKKKKIIIGVIVAVIVVLAICISSFFIFVPSIKPFKAKENVSFVINTKENFDEVLDNLENKHLIDHADLIELYAKLTMSTPNVTAGEYTINSKVSIKQLIKILDEQKTITVVIPEGYTVDQISDVFNKIGMFSKADFINAVKNYKLPEFIKPVAGRKYQLEGYLFPSTYHFKKDENVNTVISTMVSNYVLVLNEAMKATGVKITPAQINEITTKASIIEKEAKTPKEMGLVSSVINNRIKAGMPLQMDATVLYAMNKLGQNVPKVYYKDLETKSPYNTYLNKGLPVGPICNPGQTAIEAALKPTESNNLYYILTGNTSFFTDSFAAFSAEKERVIK